MPDHAAPDAHGPAATLAASQNLFAKVKALLRKEAAHTIDTLWAAIGRIIDIVTPRECQNMFAAAGYDPDWWD